MRPRAAFPRRQQQLARHQLPRWTLIKVKQKNLQEIFHRFRIS